MIAIEHLFLWFLLYSCVGWIYESILVSILEKHWVNRGFLNGPVCPIYGAGAVLGILLLSGLKGHPILIFLISALGASVLEYVTSWVMEKLFHAVVGLQRLPVQHPRACQPVGGRGVRCGRRRTHRIRAAMGG